MTGLDGKKDPLDGRKLPSAKKERDKKREMRGRDKKERADRRKMSDQHLNNIRIERVLHPDD